MSGFTPLRNLVAIMRDEGFTTYNAGASSILLPNEHVADRGTVVACGPEATSVVPGEHVIFKQWLPGPTIDGIKLCLVKDTDLFGVIE